MRSGHFMGSYMNSWKRPGRPGIVELQSKINVYGTLSKMSGVSFVSETEIDEIRQKRQEEWEKVRKEDDPLGKLVAISQG